MKGRYNGCHMTIYGHILPGAISIARSAERAGHLTEQAKHKLKILDWLRDNGNNVSLTARHFGYHRETIGLWIKQLRERGPMGLNEQSRAPKKKRTPTTSSEIVMLACKIKKSYPAWSKYKIQEILERDYDLVTSDSTVGRIFTRRGLINKKKSEKRRKAALRPKSRFPRGFSISKQGDMVQIDTKYIMLPGGKKLHQFTAIDVLTKYRVLGVCPSLSSRNGARFLKKCLDKFPFRILNIQTDNGSEFLKEFEKLCKDIKMPHYFIYPRQPKQNTYVERSHGSDKDEFYQFGNVWQNRDRMNQEIEKWQDVWNTYRPHQALNYKTPLQYLKELKYKKLSTKDTIILQT